MESSDSVKPYRGPPPRRDLVLSPSRMREIKGNDIFSTDVGNCDKQVPMKQTNGIFSSLGQQDERPTSRQSSREDYSDYSRLALQGGHKGLINGIENDCEIMDTSRKHKKCENVSEYNKLALQGGHKGLLRMDSDEQPSPVRKSKGDGELSEYSRLAKQGGHKDLLVIEENKPSPVKKTAVRNGGDWFAHDTNNNADNKTNSTANSATVVQNTTNDAPQRNGSARPSTQALPVGEEQTQRYGRKQLHQRSQIREAPFATNY